MKKAFVFTMVMVFIASIASTVYADAGWEKLKGGAMQFIKSPLQIKDSVMEEYEAAEFKPFGVVGGFFKGIFYTVKEAGTGVLRVLTFPVNTE